MGPRGSRSRWFLGMGSINPGSEGAGRLGQNRPSEGQPPREGREEGTGQGILLSAGSQDPERAKEVGRQAGETPSAGHWWRKFCAQSGSWYQGGSESGAWLESRLHLHQLEKPDVPS